MTSAESQDLAAAVLRRLGAKLPSILSAVESSGQKIVIHISPKAAQVVIEWPPEQDMVRRSDTVR